MGKFSRLVTTGMLAVLASTVAAQPADSVAAAEQLFQQGRELFDKGDFAAACPRFEASLKLDPALGTLLNLATCYDKAGQIASAWGHYREVAALAMKVGDTARVDIARERIKALEPRLPKLVIRGPKTAVPGLVVTRDDAPLENAAIGVAIYVDPGDHVITESAPDHIPASQHVTIAEDESKEIQLADLVLAPHAKPVPTITIIREADDPGRGRRVFGMTLGGAGVAAVVTAVGFGFASRSSWNSAFDDGLCHKSTYTCTPAGQDRVDTARSRALVANVVGGAGLALIGGGLALYLTAPTHRDVGIAPTAGGATVTFGGAW